MAVSRMNIHWGGLMKNRWVVLLAGIALLSDTTRSQDRGVGVGVIVGDPTGLSAKIWTAQSTALQFAVAWRTRDPFLGTRVSISGDYVWHSFDAIRSNERFPIYYGVGGTIASGGAFESALGVRGVIGIDWLSRRVPIDIFFQVTPVLVLSPSTDGEVSAGLGVRYFFD